jgi:hypothetical protein
MTVPNWNELSPEQQAEVWRHWNGLSPEQQVYAWHQRNTPPAPAVVKGRNPVASVALYAGLASLLVFPVVLGLVAIVTGIIGTVQASHGAEGAKPSAFGIVFGVVGVGIGIAFARLLF